MVPFGKHAFFPGELVHTNEFLVGLGCELQLEASAKQAAELLGRRQERAAAALARARLQLRELEARCGPAGTGSWTLVPGGDVRA